MTARDIVRSRLGVDPHGIDEICRRWEIHELSLFGSALSSDFRADSDVDLLVAFDNGTRTLLDWEKMQTELEQIFGRKVDLVEKRLVKNPFRRYSILTMRQVIYAA